MAGDHTCPAPIDPDAHRTSQQDISKALEESLQPTTWQLDHSVTKIGSSAPPSALHKTRTWSRFQDLQASTAPTYDYRGLEKDLPPERSLPFPVERKPKLNPRLARAPTEVTELDELHGRSVVSLSECKSSLSREKAVGSGEEVQAKDIDTQRLLAKVEAKKLASSNKRNVSATGAKSTSIVDTNGDSPLRKPARNTRCLLCRSKRRKCERNPKNPDGTCLPCAKVGQRCSFVAESDSGSHKDTGSTGAEVIQVQNSQETGETKVSQSLRISLRVKGIPPDVAHAVFSQTADGQVVSNSQPGHKRSSQLAMPAPKRAKRAKQDDSKHDKDEVKGKGDTKGPRKYNATDTKPGAKSALAANFLLDPSEHIRSDATTATATTLDLDPPEISVAKTRSNNLNKHTIIPSRSDGASGPRQTYRSPSIVSVCPPKANLPILIASKESTTEAQDTFRDLMTSDISTLLTVEPHEQNKMVDTFFSVALFSDDFLELAKVVEHRWKTEMFDSKV